MAVSWGPWQYDGSRRKRLGWEISQSPSSVTTATSSVDLTLDVWFETNWGVTDSVNDLTVTGSWTRSGSVSIDQGNGDQVKIWTSTISVSLVYGSTQNKSFTAEISGLEAISGTASVSGDRDVPARPYDVPAAATGVGVSRNSDTSQTVTWTRNPTTAAPYSSQKVQRWSSTNQNYITIATLSGTATSYTDTSTVANNAFNYRVLATNSAGTSTSASSGAIYTTPGTPTSASAAKVAGGDIRVAWANKPPYISYETQIWESQDGGAYALLTTVAAGVTEYNHASPSTSVTHQYRMRHVTTVGTALYSGYATTGTVLLAAAPNAPTGLAPSTTGDATEARTLTWVHNPTDSSPQSKFQIRHRAAGDAWTTEAEVVSATSSWSLAADTYTNPEDVEWEVRTWGEHADPSPYSATASFALSARPTATISSPADASTIGESTVTVTWGYYDAEATAQSAWKAELLNSSAVVVETLTGADTSTAATFATTVGNGSSWSTRVTVADGAGLWSAADTTAFTVDYDLPPTPTITAAWDWETGTVTVEVTNPGTSVGEVDAVSVDLWRSIDAGPWVKVAQGFPPNSSIVDYAPTVAGSNRYRADAISALPSIATSAEVEVITPQAGDGVSAVWLSVGPGFSQVCRGIGNVRRAAGADLVTRSVRRYAGRSKALEIAGTQDVRTWQVALDYADVSGMTQSTPDEWLSIGRQAGPFLLRNPEGLYVYASASGMSTQTDVDGVVTGVSFAAVETEGPAETAYEGVEAIISIVDNGDGTFTITTDTAAVLPDGSVTITV